jgi:hypothetical protein
MWCCCSCGTCTFPCGRLRSGSAIRSGDARQQSLCRQSSSTLVSGLFFWGQAYILTRSLKPLILTRSYTVMICSGIALSTNCSHMLPSTVDFGARSRSRSFLIPATNGMLASLPRILPQYAASEPLWGVPMNITPFTNGRSLPKSICRSWAIMRALKSQQGWHHSVSVAQPLPS